MLSFILGLAISFSNAKEFKPNDYCPLIDMITHESVAKAKDCLKTKKKLFVVSPGGLLDAGDILLKFVNKNKVTVLCLKCYSMAAMLWLNADNKELGEGAQLMLHYAYTTVPEGMPLTIQLLRQMANELETSTEKYFECLTKDQREFFLAKIRSMDTYFLDKSVLDSLGIKYEFVNKPKE